MLGKRLIRLFFLTAPGSSRYRTECQVTPCEQIGLSNNVETISLIGVTLTWFCTVRVSIYCPYRWSFYLSAMALCVDHPVSASFQRRDRYSNVQAGVDHLLCVNVIRSKVNSSEFQKLILIARPWSRCTLASLLTVIANTERLLGVEFQSTAYPVDMLRKNNPRWVICCKICFSN